MSAKVRRSPFDNPRVHELHSPKAGAKAYRSKLRAGWNWLRAEARATRPIFLFFVTGFLLVLLIVKLALAQYSISVNALSRALLGAALAAILLGFLERMVEAQKHAATILLGLHTAMASLNLNRLLAIALGVTIVFAVYFTFSEINEFMGEDALREFLLKRRTPRI